MPAPDLDFLDSVEIGVDAIGLPERHQIIVVGEGVDENSDRLSLSRYADAIRVICLENLADQVWRLIGDVGDGLAVAVHGRAIVCGEQARLMFEGVPERLKSNDGVNRRPD